MVKRYRYPHRHTTILDAVDFAQHKGDAVCTRIIECLTERMESPCVRCERQHFSSLHGTVNFGQLLPSQLEKRKRKPWTRWTFFSNEILASEKNSLPLLLVSDQTDPALILNQKRMTATELCYANWNGQYS